MAQLALPVLSTAAACVQQIQTIGKFYAVPVHTMSVLLLLASAAWSIQAIRAKTISKPIIAGNATPQYSYAYSPVSRIIAKITFVICLLFLWSVARSAADDYVPLANPIYGYLLEAGTRRPVVGATVSLIDSDSIDISKTEAITDSNGFYILDTIRRAKRSSTLIVYRIGCRKEALSLSRIYETYTDPGGQPLDNKVATAFTHFCNCVKEQ